MNSLLLVSWLWVSGGGGGGWFVINTRRSGGDFLHREEYNQLIVLYVDYIDEVTVGGVPL